MLLTTFIICSLIILSEVERNAFGNEEDSVQSEVFVDKTLLIKEFFEGTYPFTLITVPQGFGKTTNMDMIRRFCEIQTNEEGSSMHGNVTKYFKIFSNLYMKENKTSFLDVYTDKSFFNRHFAQYLVIFMDFKSLDYKSWKDFKHSLVKVVNDLFNQHKYLLGSDIFSDKEKIIFRNYQFYIICKELQPEELTKSVTILASFLCKSFNKKVILFIDEIDTIIQKSLMRNCNDTEEIISFIRDLFFNIFNTNIIFKALFNSSSRLATVLTTGVKNLDYFIFNQKHPFSRFYGFTEREVINLAKLFGLQNNMTVIQDWYNGYKIFKSGLKMYNFHSISNVMIRKDIGTYLEKGEHSENFERLFLKRQLRSKVKTLIDNGEVEAEAVKEVSIKDVLKLKQIFNDPVSSDIPSEDLSLLFDYMINLGYFTVSKFNEHNSKLKIKVPNVESKSELLDLVYSLPYFKIKLNLTEEELFAINDTLLDLKMSKFIKEPVISSTHVL